MEKLNKFSPSSFSYTGIDSVSHRSDSLPVFPGHKEVPDSRLNFDESFEELFPINNSTMVFIEQTLLPFTSKSFLKISQIQAMLPGLRRSLRCIAANKPELARKIGGVSKLLDDEKQLLELLQLYRSALFQG